MMTVYGLKQLKARIIRSAQKDDEELNALLQEFVKGVNRLIIQRSPVPPAPTLPSTRKV